MQLHNKDRVGGKENMTDHSTTAGFDQQDIERSMRMYQELDNRFKLVTCENEELRHKLLELQEQNGVNGSS